MKRETTLDNGQTNCRLLHLTTFNFCWIQILCTSWVVLQQFLLQAEPRHAKIGCMCSILSNLFQVVVYFTSTYTLEIKNNYHSTKPDRPVQMTHSI